MMEARLQPKKAMVYCHRRRWPKLKSLKTEMLVFLVSHRTDWRAQGNNCNCYYAGQGEDDTENLTVFLRRHHKYAQSE
jgi:hypothetical protein